MDRIEDGMCGEIRNSKGHLSKLAEVSLMYIYKESSKWHQPIM